MILVREIFQIKFGKMRDAKSLWKEADKVFPPSMRPARILTDLTGPHYTLVVESTHKDLAAFEAGMRQEMAGPAAAEWYQKFVPLVDSGRREIYTVVE